MAPGLVESGEMNLVEVPKLGEYRGFVFINFDPDAISLEEYLADAKRCSISSPSRARRGWK